MLILPEWSALPKLGGVVVWDKNKRLADGERVRDRERKRAGVLGGQWRESAGKPKRPKDHVSKTHIVVRVVK